MLDIDAKNSSSAVRPGVMEWSHSVAPGLELSIKGFQRGHIEDARSGVNAAIALTKITTRTGSIEGQSGQELRGLVYEQYGARA